MSYEEANKWNESDNIPTKISNIPMTKEEKIQSEKSAKATSATTRRFYKKFFNGNLDKQAQKYHNELDKKIAKDNKNKVYTESYDLQANHKKKSGAIL